MRLMIDILDLRAGDTTFDPACGTAGTLLGAIQHVQEAGGNVKKLWGRLFGQEKNLDDLGYLPCRLADHAFRPGDNRQAPP